MSALIRVLLVDDEPLVREGLRDALSVISDVEVAGECRDGLEALEAIINLAPDVVFLDIQMPGLNGFEVLRRLGERPRPVVVFVTAYDEYAVHAFEVNAVDYLLKPFDEERVRVAVERVRARLHASEQIQTDQRLERLLKQMAGSREQYAERFVGSAGGGLRVIAAKEIEWIEAADNYVRLHASGSRLMIRETMKTILSRLDPSLFVRVHRSAIVNLTCIKELRPLSNGDYMLTLASGHTLTLSRSYRDEVLRRLG